MREKGGGPASFSKSFKTMHVYLMIPDLLWVALVWGGAGRGR